MNIPSLAIAAALAFKVGPDIELSTEAELCIVKAELCVEQSPFPDPCDDISQTCTCSEDFENCAWSTGDTDLFEPACRVDYVWCVLEPPNPKSDNFKAWQAYCADAFATCPTWNF